MKTQFDAMGLGHGELVFGSLISYQFVHSGLSHAASNAIFLFIFGDNVEDALGSPLFFVGYLLSGIGAGVAYLALNDTNHVAIGASGAVSGILGMYCYFFRDIQLSLVVGWKIVRTSAAIAILAWVAEQILFYVFVEKTHTLNIAFSTHLGGFATGWLYAWVLVKLGIRKREFPWRDLGFRIATKS